MSADASDNQASPRKRHRMVDRVAALLELAARNPSGLTLTELARNLEAPVSSIQGLVNGLVATGYLDEYDRRYRLGTAPYLLSLMAGRHLVTRVSHDDLEKLHGDTGLTALLSVAVGQDVFYIDSCSSEPRYDYLAKNYVRRSMIRTSSGWVLLAGLGRRDLWSYLSSLGSDDERRVERFLAVLDSLQSNGICAAPHISDVADGVAAAVREGGRTVAAVSIVAAPEVIHDRRDELVSVLQEHSARWNRDTA